MRRVLPALAVAALLGGGCSGGDGGDDDDGDLARYCELDIELSRTLTDPDVDFETATDEEIEAAYVALAEDVLPTAEAMADAAPTGVRDDVAVIAAALRELAAGDLDAAGEEEAEASSSQHQWSLDHCGWEVVDVSMTEYAFEGVPATLEPGTVSFELSNDGTETHELVLVRRNDDVTESFDELLALSFEAVQSKVTYLGNDLGEPGEENLYVVGDLEPGEYLAACFVPVGGTGPPHVTEGMKATFRVA